MNMQVCMNCKYFFNFRHFNKCLLFFIQIEKPLLNVCDKFERKFVWNGKVLL